MDRWAGKVALVTGASAGVGAVTVETLVREGLTVVGVARRVENVEKLGEKLKGAKGKLWAKKCDVTKEEEILEVVEWIKKTLGGIDVLINNAGMAYFASISDGDTEGFRRVLDVNVLAVAILTREAIRSMKARQVDGHIININSVLGHEVPDVSDKYSLYPSSKYAVTAMTEVTRKELIKANTKIKVTSISPSLIKTEFLAAATNEAVAKAVYNQRPALNPEDVANAIVYALGTPAHVQVCELVLRTAGAL
ncbi:farnesol dehydrogenase-like [Diprion similis]|uniref:farnesol dehydrogenase-like n=1 Tax=Diprion similis TaxID=362088 RepID=UPI001EF80F3E|nr:farnesol dehydrogenase-like [Diprion similis]